MKSFSTDTLGCKKKLKGEDFEQNPLLPLLYYHLVDFELTQSSD